MERKTRPVASMLPALARELEKFPAWPSSLSQALRGIPRDAQRELVPILAAIEFGSGTQTLLDLLEALSRKPYLEDLRDQQKAMSDDLANGKRHHVDLCRCHREVRDHILALRGELQRLRTLNETAGPHQKRVKRFVEVYYRTQQALLLFRHGLLEQTIRQQVTPQDIRRMGRVVWRQVNQLGKQLPASPTLPKSQSQYIRLVTRTR
jgi:hypothetical protein